jgi:hypothetical protein
MNTLSLLLSSRKVWSGIISILAVAGAVLLRVLDKIPADALTPTILAIMTAGTSVILSTAWEDVAKHAAGSHKGNLLKPPNSKTQEDQDEKDSLASVTSEAKETNESVKS